MSIYKGLLNSIVCFLFFSSSLGFAETFSQLQESYTKEPAKKRGIAEVFYTYDARAVSDCYNSRNSLPVGRPFDSPYGSDIPTCNERAEKESEISKLQIESIKIRFSNAVNFLVDNYKKGQITAEQISTFLNLSKTEQSKAKLTKFLEDQDKISELKALINYPTDSASNFVRKQNESELGFLLLPNASKFGYVNLIHALEYVSVKATVLPEMGSTEGLINALNTLDTSVLSESELRKSSVAMSLALQRIKEQLDAK